MGVSTTTYRGYKKPDLGYNGTPDWGTLFNDNAAMIDADIGKGYTPVGLDADKPASPSVGDTFIASDTGIFYKCLADGVWTGTIAAAEIPAGSVTTAKLADGAVTADKIASGAIGSAALASGAVTTTKIATGAVDTTALASGAVTTAKLASGAVDSTKLAAGAVTTDKLAADSVTLEKITPGTVYNVVNVNLSYGTFSTTSTTWVAVTDASATITTHGGALLMAFAFMDGGGDSATNTTPQLTFFLDGSNVGENDGVLINYWSTYTIMLYVTDTLAAGSHTVAVYMKGNTTNGAWCRPQRLTLLEVNR